MIRQLLKVILFLIISTRLSAQNKATDLHPLFELGLTYEEFVSQIPAYCDYEVIHYSKQMAAPFEKQSQFTCSNIEVLGKERKVEFLINDGRLGHIWIFLDEEEVEVIENELQMKFGKVIKAIKNYKIFESENIAIRTNPSEILIANKELLYEISNL